MSPMLYRGVMCLLAVTSPVQYFFKSCRFGFHFELYNGICPVFFLKNAFYPYHNHNIFPSVYKFLVFMIVRSQIQHLHFPVYLHTSVCGEIIYKHIFAVPAFVDT